MYIPNAIIIYHLKWPAEPGKVENFALLLIYNSFNVVHAPISSGNALKLFDDKDNRRIAYKKNTDVIYTYIREYLWTYAFIDSYCMYLCTYIYIFLSDLINFLSQEESWIFYSCTIATLSNSLVYKITQVEPQISYLLLNKYFEECVCEKFKYKYVWTLCNRCMTFSTKHICKIEKKQR